MHISDCLCKILFSRESDSTITNVRPFVRLSVCLQNLSYSQKSIVSPHHHPHNNAHHYPSHPHHHPHHHPVYLLYYHPHHHLSIILQPLFTQLMPSPFLPHQFFNNPHLHPHHHPHHPPYHHPHHYPSIILQSPTIITIFTPSIFQ